MIRLGLVLLFGFIAPAFAQQAETSLANLQAEIGRMAQSAGGSVGVAVRHIQTGRRLQINGDGRFPMASTVKISIAVQLLTLVDEGKLSLDKIITVRSSDMRQGSGTLVKTFDSSRPDYSVRSLLELMLIDSDNSATDMLFTEAGGSGAVMARLQALGVQGISADRPIGRVLDDARRGRDGLATGFFRDPRDTATPAALLELVLKIWRREALSPERTELLLDIMYRCATGRGRLPGLLPPGTKVARKTGTLGVGVTNDVGIITLPGDAGHVAIAVMIRESVNNLPTQERAIAEIARAVYDYFAANP